MPVREVPLAAEDKDTSISGYPESNQATRAVELLQTKQSTLRLSAELSDRLQAVCRENGISREVLIEGLFEYYESTPSARSQILDSAKRRGQQRQQVANFRRAQSMMDRFGNNQ